MTMQESIRIKSFAQQGTYTEFVTLVHRTQQLIRNPLLLNWTQERPRADPIVQRIFNVLANQKSGTIRLLLKSHTTYSCRCQVNVCAALNRERIY